MITLDMLTDEPVYPSDPRWAYAELSIQSAYAGWPCGQCGVRRDEHADQELQNNFPQLDITDHVFVEML